MRLLIVSGMSGAGKSSVMKILEDDGFYCVDNLPVALLADFLSLTKKQKEDDADEGPQRIAVGLDIRMIETGGASSIKKSLNVVEEFKKDYDIDILFLEASTGALVRRFKETRRIHPLFAMSKDSERIGERVEQAIEEERELLSAIRKKADVILDSSSMLIRDLKAEIDRLYCTDDDYVNFYLTFVSFGYKYGIPTDADLVFDVRFLPNPYYVEDLKKLTGDDKEVVDYVMQGEEGKTFLRLIKDLFDFLIPNYRIEGKTGIVIAIGCTGGKHRSVTLTNALYDIYKDGQFGCKKFHRDIDKDRKRGK
ncbi:MAG: RNase adapter RapZ [Eubacterium sp.]|nr:RNase adapter RapZ [Eubacterium sp.]